MASSSKTTTDRGPAAVPDLPALAGRLQLLTDPGRVIILLTLDEREHYVGELCQSLEQAQVAVSAHLQLLRVAGLVEPRRAGKHVHYSLTDAGRAVVAAVRRLAGIGD